MGGLGLERDTKHSFFGKLETFTIPNRTKDIKQDGADSAAFVCSCSVDISFVNQLQSRSWTYTLLSHLFSQCDNKLFNQSINQQVFERFVSQSVDFIKSCYFYRRGTTYIHWGKKSCSGDAETVYSGMNFQLYDIVIVIVK